MSLRLRFILLPIIAVLTGLLGLGALAAWDAGAQVRAETDANVQMGRLIASGAITHAGRAVTAQEALDNLRRELPPSVRDLRLSVEAAGVAGAPTPRSRLSAVPGWFEQLVDAPPIVERYPIILAGGQVGSVVLRSSADKATSRAWEKWRRDVSVIGLVAAVIILAILLASHLALAPLRAFTRAFDRLDRGDLSARVNPGGSRTLRRLAERFNRLAPALEQAAEDNRRLVGEASLVQADERRAIAQELHDGYGPPLFAIRSDLGALSRWVRKKEPRFDEIEARLLSISGLVAQIQRINSQLLERLRRP